MRSFPRNLLWLFPAILLAGCPSLKPRPLTQPETQTIIAHYNNGDPILAVSEKVLMRAFESHFKDGTIVTAVWIEVRGARFLVSCRGTNQGRARGRSVEIVRDSTNPENMYVSLQGSVQGRIGDWR